jgi:hypothetical protein
MENFVIRKNWQDRWIIAHPLHEFFAWSGLRWVVIGSTGIPTTTQVCSFATASEAARCAEQTVVPVPAPAEGTKSELSPE